MRNFIIIGLSLAALIALLILYLYIDHRKGLTLTANLKESQLYVDHVVKFVCKNWDENLLLQESSPEMLKAINKTPEDYRKLFKLLKSRLGALRRYKIINSSFFNNKFKFGKAIPDATAAYILNSSFTNGEATLKISIVLINGKWRLNTFNVSLKR